MLFELPAELRTCIFEFALHGDPNFPRYKLSVTDHNNFQEPGLLQTCRSIRKETYPMLWTAKRFYIYLSWTGWDRMMWFENHCKKIGLFDKMDLYVQSSDRQTEEVSILGFWKYCVHIHAGGEWFPRQDGNARHDAVVLAAFEIAERLRHVRWKDVAATIELAIEAVKYGHGMNPLWQIGSRDFWDELDAA